MSPEEDTQYSVTVTNSYQCSKDASVQVTVHPLPEITLKDTAICRGEDVVLDAGYFAGYQWSTGATSRTIDVSPEEDTQYSVTVTNAYQCSNNTSILVMVYPLPEVSLGRDTTVCNGATLILDAGDHAAYRWSTGSDSRQITVSTTGDYRVEVTDEHGCVNGDTIYVEFTVCTGTGSEKAGRITVYPNPTRGRVTISGLNVAEVVWLEVLDAAGRTVTVIQPDQEEVQVDLQHESPGIFFIRIYLRNGERKVVKVRRER